MGRRDYIQFKPACSRYDGYLNLLFVFSFSFFSIHGRPDDNDNDNDNMHRQVEVNGFFFFFKFLIFKCFVIFLPCYSFLRAHV
jgi:hypothetical protein